VSKSAGVADHGRYPEARVWPCRPKGPLLKLIFEVARHMFRVGRKSSMGARA
jgi:hypothetical protein